MSQKEITRRHFLEAGAGACAAVAASGVLYDSVPALQAFAAQNESSIGNYPDTHEVPTLCEGCFNNCGAYSYNIDGQFRQMYPDYGNPASDGTLCARGYSYSQTAFSDDAIDSPLKRLPSGRYDALTWDMALAEIGQKIEELSGEHGAGCLAMAYVPDTVTSFYGPRLMNALGTSNAFVDDVVFNSAKAAGFAQVIGTTTYTPDFANADLAVLIDTSYNDITRPDLIKQIQALRSAGKPVVAVDSRLGDIAAMADEWISVAPGTEMALLLAVCNQLIKTGRYDKAFVDANSAGLEQWAADIVDCTPTWAAEITGATEAQIEGLISMIDTAAPRVAIEYGNSVGGVGNFTNTAETARVVCLLNTLTGAWNATGGALLPFDWSAYTAQSVAGSVNSPNFELETVFDANAYPLADAATGSMATLVTHIKTHEIKALITVNDNIAANYACVNGFDAALSDLELIVAITREMDETAQMADYVLPTCSFLESQSLPKFIDGTTAAVSLRTQALDQQSLNRLPIQAILSLIADSAGVEGKMDVTIEDICEAQLGMLGLTTEALNISGTATLTEGVVERIQTWNTPTGLIQFASTQCQDCGLTATPTWMEPASVGEAEAAGDEGLPLALITGELTAIGPDSANIARLMNIADMYALQSAWISNETAQELGVQTGDSIAITGDLGADLVRVNVTDRINPNAIFLPRFFGAHAEGLHVANGKGINPLTLTKAWAMPGYGAVCTQGAPVIVQKAGE